MVFMDLLTGVANRFDSGMMLKQDDSKALRDAVVDLMARLSRLEQRFEPAKSPDQGDSVTDEQVNEVVAKKRGRPTKA